MNDEELNEERLARRFRELRARDAKEAPSFEALTAKRPRRVSPLVVLAPMLAAAAVLVVWCGTMQNASKPAAVAFDSPPMASVAPEIHPPPAPTALPLDFLLETTPIRVSLDSDLTEGLAP